MATKQKNELYEGMYIVSNTLSEEARTKAFERITQGITEQGGEIKKVHDQGRKKLAYQVNGRREGYFYLIYFEAPPELIKDLWNEYHLNEDMIRFMIVKADEVMETIEFKQLEEF